MYLPLYYAHKEVSYPLLYFCLCRQVTAAEGSFYYENTQADWYLHYVNGYLYFCYDSFALDSTG